MVATTVQNVTIECSIGDIAAQDDLDAVVNAANAELMPGGGVAGAIHRAAGRGLAEECESLAPIKPGEAVITGAHNMPNKHIIHCLGPVYGRDEPADQLLANCYRNALELAEKNSIRSIGFPSISTGAFGYPMRDAAEVAFETIRDVAPDLKVVERIRYVLFDQKALDVHEQAMRAVFEA